VAEDINRHSVRSRRAVILWIVFSVFGVATVVALCLYRLKPLSHPQEVTFADGTILKIEAVTVGKDHSFASHPLREKLRSWLPKPCRPWLGKSTFSAKMETAPDSIVIWISQSDPTRPNALFPGSESHYIIDCHGCRFESRNRTINKAAAGCVKAVTFEGFPRGDETFDYFIAVGSRNTPTRFRITNPVKIAPMQWTPQELPITRTNGDLVAQLRALNSISFPQAPFDPDIRLIGPPDSRFWENVSVRIFDPLGKCAPRAFCTNNPVWRIEADFFRKPTAPFRADEILRITNVSIPPKDGITQLRRTNRVQGSLVIVDSLQGAAYVAQDPRLLALDGPALLIWSQQWHGESKLMVKARDDAGRTLVTRARDQLPAGSRQPFNPEHRLFEIQTWPESKSLTIEVIIQKPVRFEFFIDTKATHSSAARQ